jgi:hypothetical protein
MKDRFRKAKPTGKSMAIAYRDLSHRDPVPLLIYCDLAHYGE